MVTDVSMAVVEMGADVSGLKTYAKRLSRSRIPHRKLHTSHNSFGVYVNCKKISLNQFLNQFFNL